MFRGPASRRSGVAAAAAALLLAALALAPAPALAGLDTSAGPDCPAVMGYPAATGRTVGFSGSLQCYRPGAPGFSSTTSRPSEARRLSNPTPGAPCANIDYNPVSFSESNQGIVKASYTFLGGTNGASIGLNADDAVMATTHDALVADVQSGTYQPSNPADPNSPLQCNLQPIANAQDYCPTAADPVGTFCYIWVVHAITPASSAMPALAPFLGRVVGDIKGDAGRIGSAPSQTGVVNTAQCYFIDDLGIPAERDLTLVLPGAPDGSGRRVYYTFLVRIQYQGVEWNFDDPFSNVQVQPAAECELPHHDVLTAHSYRQISDDMHPDHRYHVTAVEHYSITADVYWVDSDGSHHDTVDPGVPAPAVSPTGLAQYVGQVEGVPVGG